MIVSRTEPPPPPTVPTPPAPAPGAPTRLRTLATVAIVTGLLAGALGGAVGYVAAVHRGAAPVVIGHGGSGAQQRPAESVAGVVARVMPSVVTVAGTTAQGQSIGSGFVISSDGYLLTNDHVVEDVADGKVTVTFADSTAVGGQVVGRDPESDIAVVKVGRSNLPAAEFADSDAVAVGDAVIAVGAPLALSGTVTAGIVSALDRTIETQDANGEQRFYAAIQTDAAINRGNSGGPLFDMAGRVIGVNSVIKSMVGDGEEGGNIGIAFAIPINQAARVATDIIDTGKAKRTVIGAELGATSTDSGVRLSRIDAGGPADEAGLRTGDVITRLGTHLIQEPGDLIALVRRYDPGTVVTITYRRGGSTLTTSVTLAADAN